MLAEAMGLPVNRVALRGEEILSRFVFLDSNLKKDSLMVTPLGICLNYYEQNNNFIYVTVNKERIKLYNNGKLRVVDALMQMNVPNENIFPKRGRTIRFTINGEIRLLKGQLGEAASVTLNGEAADIRSTIRKNDFVEITYSTKGEDAEMKIADLAEYKKMVDEPLAILVNGHVERPDYEIANGDIISIESLDESVQPLTPELPATPLVKEPVAERRIESVKSAFNEFIVAVNGQVITMKGKEQYIFVDIFDYIDFDLKSPKGRKIVTKVNGVPVANYMQELPEGAIIELYWED
jgi:sulfur carrier protein ThiS